MNRLNSSPPKHGNHTVLWWVAWITLTIATFFIGYAFWTPFIARHVGGMGEGLAPILWVTAVFGTWMVLLVPLIIVMYNKVDRTYEESRTRKESAAGQKKLFYAGVGSDFIPETERRLPPALVQKIKKMPPAIPRGHLVTALLKNGRRVEFVFVLDQKEMMGVYGQDKAFFSVSDIADVFPADLDNLPAFETQGWLRFDLAPEGRVV